MGADSKIEWTHHTFNAWIGCQRVSPGCEHCYAEALSKRMGWARWGPKEPRKILSEAYWRGPLKWNRDAASVGERHRVFCSSLSDVFEDRPELREHRQRLFGLIIETPHLDWLLLTKRPENVERLMPDFAAPFGVWPDNVWLGTTVEDQRRADERIGDLLRIPAAVRFLSAEPLLEAVDLKLSVRDQDDVGRVDWVIAGGESGPGARPFELSWARNIVRQCRDAGVPVLVKQLGAAASDPENGIAGASLKVHPDAAGLISIRLKDRKGGDWSEWPEDLRIREYPVVAQDCGGVLAHAPDCRSRR